MLPSTPKTLNLNSEVARGDLTPEFRLKGKITFSGKTFQPSFNGTVITQKDLSAILGVHQTTISGVLNQRPDVRVSPETRKRILEAVEKYGYKPSLQAQILRQGRSSLIGILNFNPGMFGVERQLLTVEALQEKGFSPLINEVFSPDRAMESLELFLDLKVSGIVLKSMPLRISALLEERLLAMPIPAVSMDGAYVPGIPWVRPDKAAAMEGLTLQLIKSGYRRLALLTPFGGVIAAPNYSHSSELVKGFQSAVEILQGSVDSSEIISRSAPVESADPLERLYIMGTEAARQLIAERKELPEVLVCNDDQWALGAMAACFEAGIKVPQDISITGFGNNIVGQFSPIPLTTINQPHAVIASEAVNILCQRIANPDEPYPPITKVDSHEVVLRQSTRIIPTPR